MIADKLRMFLESISGMERERFSDDYQRRLAECLEDGSVYAIVNSLTHLQELKETELYNQRFSRIRELSDPNDLKKIAEIDIRIIEQMDELVKEQQSNLCCVGVPDFKVTMEADELRFQITVLRFIQTLNEVFG